MNTIFRFLLVLLLALAGPAQAQLKGGAWQEAGSSTGAINGTPPSALGAILPVYHDGDKLDPRTTYEVEFSDMPRSFSANTNPSVMRAIMALDTEGDLFSDPPTISWPNNEAPAMSLLWADASDPDKAPVTLNPQPVPNQTFCAQNLAGRTLVTWPQVDDDSIIPTVQLYTLTGVPNFSDVQTIGPQVTLKIKPADTAPVTASGDHVDAAFKASKVQTGESITLTITTQACNGKPAPNAPFVIRRGDALNRQGKINNTFPVRVGDTVMTTTETEYHGLTDGDGKATVVVTQTQGPGVKTPLHVTSVNFPELSSDVDVIFTVLTSPNSDQANMYGHMPESTSADLNGITYNFTRPKLAVEASEDTQSIDANNETWAQFTWSGADSHCPILPASQQLIAMRNAHGTLETYVGWPAVGNAEYWSSTRAQTGSHYAVHVGSGSSEIEADGSKYLVSCVDKALPAVYPQITLSPQDSPYQTQIGNTIDVTVSVVDKNTQEPLPYRYLELYLDPAINRKGVHDDAWNSHRVVIESRNVTASSPALYTGMTDANGQVQLTLKHDDGMGVETPIRIVMTDDDGVEVVQPFSVIFTVVTSPDVDGANMWGHMRGVVDAGNLYKRPLLAVEASAPHGQQSENNEEWATFSSVEAATSQCGTGQVPDTSSLTHLYGENPSNKMETDHGWPTGQQSYITAEAGAQPVNVSLENGNTGDGGANYLTCSANEIVSTLDVYFNDAPDIRSNPVAKVGEPIKMNVRSVNALNRMPIPNVNFTVTLSPGKQRDNLTTGFIDASKGELLFDDVAYSAAQTAVYRGMTDANGRADIILTQPRGVGIKTSLDIVPVGSLISSPVTRTVTFTVATSPDTANANMWGHMADTITVGGLTFERPKLAKEATSASRTQVEANEIWARVLHTDAAGNPAAGGCAANRLPRIDQLDALYKDNSDGVIKSVHGWPTLINYWSSTYQTATSWKLMALSNGSEFSSPNASVYVSCLTSDNPTGTSITIEPVDNSQKYDNGDIHAVKAKKGETIQLKVTVKDAVGQPIPEAPFVLSRGDGYDRQGAKYAASEGGSTIVSPVVIDGESLAWSSAKMGSQTGADGSRIINVTRPDTHGTLTAITASLYDDATASASIDTIFTVVTSPDVAQAHMWGHMLPSLTAKDGAEYQRPLLYDELTSTTNAISYTEDNENWAGFYGPDSGKSNPANCGVGYYPSVEALRSLQEAYDNRTIKTGQGWPINRSYWSGTRASDIGTTKPYNWMAVDLEDGNASAVANNSVSSMQYQICSATPMDLSMGITLTSTLPTNTDFQAVTVKSSESIPLLVTTTDAAGSPRPYTSFVLERDAGAPRNDNGPYKVGDIAMTFTSSGSAYPVLNATTKLYGMTGADGTLALELTEPAAPGVKNILTASLSDAPTVMSSLPVVFTVITSPNSTLAYMYGHMPETFTASNGAKFKRPLLLSELPVKTGNIYGHKTGNEEWYKINFFDTQGSGACPVEQMATMDDYLSLYGDHPGGTVTADLGLSTALKWWASDRVLVESSDGIKLGWQSIDLNTGKVVPDVGNGNYFQQLCLTAPRKLSITFSSTAWNGDKSAAVAKKGEALPMTVKVTDAAGKPQKKAVVQLARASSFSRTDPTKQPVPKTISSPHEITTAEAYMSVTSVSPAGAAAEFNDKKAKWYGVTGDDGTLQFTLEQKDSLGLKTAITASSADQPTATSGLDAIFTVPTSPDSPYAAYWGHMPDTVAVNGITLRRPLLRAEMDAIPPAEWKLNNENWGPTYFDNASSHPQTSLAYICGTYENAATMDDLQALQGKIGELHWPTSVPTSSYYSYDYVSQTGEKSSRCSFNETTGTPNCTRNGSNYGFAACRVP
ncbi:adhesion domain-containing protein [Citrobacter portucalensis]|uniref:adhesion domain-containing protein n=1 Tax=Citrobacter portucalensis TaxID=1639133 RepID=UPI0039767D51